MSQHFVCLTFDLDNTSGAIARGMTTPTMISRGDFGMVATDRLLQLLGKRQILGTWFIPGHTIETYPASVRAVHAAGHEIAHHGWTHRVPATLGREAEEAELTRGNEAIKTLTGRYARGYRSPSWDLSPHSIELLLAHGFTYDSSLMGHDYLPYQARDADIVTLEEPIRYGADTSLVEMPISWSLDDYPVFEYMRLPNAFQAGLMNADLVGANWFADFQYMASSPIRSIPMSSAADTGCSCWRGSSKSCARREPCSSPWNRPSPNTGCNIRTDGASAGARGIASSPCQPPECMCLTIERHRVSAAWDRSMSRFSVFLSSRTRVSCPSSSQYPCP
jgi:peptidoglycan-N-acetylglucosamine deacetylase